MFVVFDLDGTLADIRHRVHHVRSARPNWESFFAECVDEVPNIPVVNALRAHIFAGDRVEIWSARSDVVRLETEAWLWRQGIDPRRLVHMRAKGDNTPDVVLKRHWLMQLHETERPDVVYDDRQRVVDMWREEGVACFQVAANWEDDARQIAPVASPLLTIMVGPSCGGKSTWVKFHAPADQVLSSDGLRIAYTGTVEDQSRNEDVFYALHKVAKSRLDCGLPVTIDATNLRRKDRLACAVLAPASAQVRYVVCDRSLPLKLATAGWRADVRIGDVSLIEAHDQRFRSQLKDIMAGDNLPNVTVLDARNSAEPQQVAA
ncbi:phosphatase domain-containing protein [Bosea sp. NPDC055332]